MNDPSLSPVKSNAPQEEVAWQGRLQLTYALTPVRVASPKENRTVMCRRLAQAPLKVQRSFYPEPDGTCHSVLLHTAGGLVGGDRLDLEVQLQPQAQVLLTTAAATKIYRSNGPTAQQVVRVQVGAGACLEWLPQEAIVFNGANYCQQMRVDLDGQATWIGWELVRLGRTARQEKFATGNWRSHLEVWQEGRRVWVDPQWLVGGAEMLHSLQGLAGYPVVATLAYVGRSVPLEVVETARSFWQPQNDQNLPLQTGVTRLEKGLLCRYRGHSTTEARRWFIQVWHLLRATQLHRPGCIPRVWQWHAPIR